MSVLSFTYFVYLESCTKEQILNASGIKYKTTTKRLQTILHSCIVCSSLFLCSYFLKRKIYCGVYVLLVPPHGFEPRTYWLQTSRSKKFFLYLLDLTTLLAVCESIKYISTT